MVVAQTLPPCDDAGARAPPTRASIYDLYAPLPIEHLAFDAARTPRRATPRACSAHRPSPGGRARDRRRLRLRERAAARPLARRARRARPHRPRERYRRDPSLRDLIDVVPFGIDPEPPVATRPVLKGVVPGIGETTSAALGRRDLELVRPADRDPRGARALAARDDVRLYFLGVKHPNPASRDGDDGARRRARGRARAPRPRRLLQLRLGPVRRARRTCSRRTSASRRTSTTSRPASPSARACSTASGPACRS